MEPITNIEIIAHKETRKPLQILQPAATDKKILVGGDKVFRSTKQKQLKEKTKGNMAKTKKDAKSKKVTTENKAIQTVREEELMIESEDLTSIANPSENYWQLLAERRRVALADTLGENKTLRQCIEKLKEENREYKEMLDETKTLIEVLQEEIETKDDINNLLNDDTL
ncbi:geminin [Camponotus floridanus]|uniref:geminin n=1 Tax=Camponotus floridanus TaxID=104421 RepID=UPI00059BFC88|nr:geminin [Camponotus floridanus]XP_011259009.1 geminin [Camponotus floridanus]